MYIAEMKNPAYVGCKKEWLYSSAFTNESETIIDVCTEGKTVKINLCQGDGRFFGWSYLVCTERSHVVGWDVICSKNRNH